MLKGCLPRTFKLRQKAKNSITRCLGKLEVKKLRVVAVLGSYFLLILSFLPRKAPASKIAIAVTLPCGGSCGPRRRNHLADSKETRLKAAAKVTSSEPQKSLLGHCGGQKVTFCSLLMRDGKGTPKNFRDKDFAELSGELSGVICLKTLVLMGNDR